MVGRGSIVQGVLLLTLRLIEIRGEGTAILSGDPRTPDVTDASGVRFAVDLHKEEYSWPR
jgi:hypothetical protein